MKIPLKNTRNSGKQKIGWSEENKNIGTLRKIEDANQQETEFDSFICMTCDNYSENGYCFDCHMQACTPGNHY